MHVASPATLFARRLAVELAAAFALLLHAAPVLAQGSTGGSIGKQDKSISGNQESPRSAPATRKSSKSGGGGSNYDGLWNAASFGQTCSLSVAGVVTISSGRLTADGMTGAVSGGGSVTASWSGGGLSATFSGRISGRNGTGRFQRSDGCVGRWTMSKQ